MRRITLLCTIILSAQLAARFATGASIPPALEPFLGEPVFVPMQQLWHGRGGTNIVTAKDGTVVAFQSLGSNKIRRSRDGGRTWDADIEIGPGATYGNALVDEIKGDILYVNPRAGFLWRSRDHGVMAVCAVQNGLLKLDERAADTLTELKTDPRKSKVTIRQLLSLSSGIDGGANGSPPTYRRTVAVAEAIGEPGKQFSYGPIAVRKSTVSQIPSKPNVLMIIADDLNDWIGCLGGHPDVKTPNLDRLAQRGLLFANAHCVAPLCNPSRVATFTGQCPSTTGVYLNGVVWHEVLPGIRTIPQHFKANGYYVAGGGKVYHHPPGFNRRSDWNEYFDQVFDGHYQARLARGEDPATFAWPEGFPLNQLPAVKALARPPQNPNEFDWGPFDREDLQMGDGQMVQWAEKFLAQPPKQPFFLAAGIYRPHLPWYVSRQYFDMYPPDRVAQPPVKADDLNDVPEAGLRIAAERRGDLDLVMQAGKYRQVLQAYLASVTFCDTMVGRLLDALDAGPAAKNTIIIFWSDNGWHFGEKQHLHKSTLWERATHVPFLVVAPGVTREQSRTTRPVSLVDLFPTLNELCGLPQPAGLDGVSLVPLLRDPGRAWDRPAVTTHQQGNHAVCSERWRYIRYADGGEELYDHQNDPNEWTNFAAKPEFATVKAELAKWLPKTDAPAASEKGKHKKAEKPE